MIFQFSLYILIVVSATWVIYDVWVYGKQDTAIKVLWTVLAVAFNILTAIIYSVARKRR